MKYTRRLSWGSQIQFLKTSGRQVQNDLSEFHVLIGSGMAPGILFKAGLSLDIFVPYGWDLWEYTRLRSHNPSWIAKTWPAVIAQRKGIARSAIFHMAPTNDLYEDRWRTFRGTSARWSEAAPIIHAPTYARERLEYMSARSHWAREFHAIRAETELMVVSHARHVWRISETAPSAKGTDKLLKGWAEFRRRRPDVRARLVTMEYGQDVQWSKRLITELGIADSVIWMPEMSRKDIMVGLLLSDIVCGEFQNSWMTAGTFYEALVAAKPLMSYRDDTIYAESFPNLYPIMNAFTPGQIAEQLGNYCSMPQKYIEMGRQGLAWYNEHVATFAIDRYTQYIRSRLL